MGAQVIDYRVSMLVVLCKDCGEDVGLYPARHKCNQVIRPSLPPLPMSMSNQDNPSTLSTRPPANDRKWSFRSSTSEKKEEEESNYLDQFTATANLPESDPSSSAGKRLWGKLRQNEKWNQLNEKHNAAEKPSGKLWKRLIEATQNMSVREDSGPDSDESDWEGESHVSRILREHYEKKHQPLPMWLRDDRRPTLARAATTAGHRQHHQQHQQQQQLQLQQENDLSRRPSRKQRLWDTPEEGQVSSRELERQALRRAATSASKPMSDKQNNYYSNNSSSSSSSNRQARYYSDLDGDRRDEFQQQQYIPPSTNMSRSRSERASPSFRTRPDAPRERHSGFRKGGYLD